MANSNGNGSGIPSWQRSQRPQPLVKPPTQEQVSGNNIDEATENAEAVKAASDASLDIEEAVPSEATSESTMEPSIATATGRVRDATFEAGEFANFVTEREASEKVSAAVAQQAVSSTPPIITYPEFLVEAHKPPPLITPSRIINTAYIVSGVTALLYGASKYLVGPMSDSLTESRHDFALHSGSKVDEFNERLAKLVSRIPEANAKEASTQADGGPDDNSEISDPTELFHRDMGTQTSPAASRSSSDSGIDGRAKSKVDLRTHEMSSIQAHLAEMLRQSESLETVNQRTQAKMSDLQLYVDTLMYTSPSINSWSQNDKAWKEGDKKEDLIEEFKKEIRGVKGVLLSAKRFPNTAVKVPE